MPAILSRFPRRPNCAHRPPIHREHESPSYPQPQLPPASTPHDALAKSCKSARFTSFGMFDPSRFPVKTPLMLMKPFDARGTNVAGTPFVPRPFQALIMCRQILSATTTLPDSAQET